MKKAIILISSCFALVLITFTACSNNNNSDANTKAENKVNFELNQTIKHQDLCELSDLYSEVLDDDAKAQGWYYYYTDTDNSPATRFTWKPANDNYTTAEVLFTVKNTTDKPQKFGDKISAKMIYQENKDAQPINYDGTVFQQNPNQIDDNGQIMMWSTKPVEIAPGQSTNVSFRFDIPKDVYDKIYLTANGSNPGIIETCEFKFDDSTTYVIDLAKTLVLASKQQ